MEINDYMMFLQSEKQKIECMLKTTHDLMRINKLSENAIYLYFKRMKKDELNVFLTTINDDSFAIFKESNIHLKNALTRVCCEADLDFVFS